MNAKTTPQARSADYVIIGAGSAGCALAYRLGLAGQDVLIIEAGGRDSGILIDMPAALSYPMNMPRYNWGLASQPEPALSRRHLACPRGKVWGGSSAINGMVYVRGHREDFNTWQKMGATGWSYDDVLPYFQRMEQAPSGSPDWRGQSGPVHITRAAAEHPLHQAFLAAGQEAGYGYTEDYNGTEPEGFCHFDQTIYRGVRWSAARAFLHPALALPNVQLLTARARRIVFNGDRAVGAEVRIGREVVNISAGREVILSASAIHSPQLLMVSGIGDAHTMRRLGIRQMAERPGVGQNLQDHLEIYVQRRCKKPITLNRHFGYLSRALIGARWLAFKSGLGATNHFESGAFLRLPDADYANIQIHFLPAAVRYDGKHITTDDGFQAHVGPMRSATRGCVQLRDAQPENAPLITFNYMQAVNDFHDFRHAIRMVHDLFRQPAMREFAGAPIAPAGLRDAELDSYIRSYAESAYHPCGTCRMGAEDDKQAVVDPDCRVIGVAGLRVVDSSIFPSIPYGNINAPSMMVGEKAADHILGCRLQRKGEL